MFRCHHGLLIAAAWIVTANASVRTTYGALMGEVVRVVENPFDPVKRIGFGLADDGTYLYATAVDDGIIRVIDRQSLEVLREIPTPATNYSPSRSATASCMRVIRIHTMRLQTPQTYSS